MEVSTGTNQIRHLDVTKYDTNIWSMIFQYVPTLYMVRFISTCKHLHTRFCGDTRIVTWRERWYSCRILDDIAAPIFNYVQRSFPDYISICYKPLPLKCNFALADAAATGDLSLVRVFLRDATCTSWAVYKASRHDHTEVVKFISAADLPQVRNYSRDTTEFALHGTIVRCGRLNVVIPGGTPSYVLIEAMRNGDLEAISNEVFLLRFGHTTVIRAVKIAAANGHLNILRWIYDQSSLRGTILHAVPYAVDGNHIPIIKWWMEEVQHYYLYEEIILRAATYGRMSALEYVESYKHKKPFSRKVKMQICANAIVNGHLDVLKWLNRHSPLDRLMRLKRMAGRHGRSDIRDFIDGLQWQQLRRK